MSQSYKSHHVIKRNLVWVNPHRDVEVKPTVKNGFWSYEKDKNQSFLIPRFSKKYFSCIFAFCNYK